MQIRVSVSRSSNTQTKNANEGDVRRLTHGIALARNGERGSPRRSRKKLLITMMVTCADSCDCAPGQRLKRVTSGITPRPALHGNPRSSSNLLASVLSRNMARGPSRRPWIRRFRRELLSCFGGSTNLRGSKSQANGGHFGVHAAKQYFGKLTIQRGLAFQGMAARPYHWFRALTTYGVVLPDVDRLWTAWWSIDTIGRAFLPCNTYRV